MRVHTREHGCIKCGQRFEARKDDALKIVKAQHERDGCTAKAITVGDPELMTETQDKWYSEAKKNKQFGGPHSHEYRWKNILYRGLWPETNLKDIPDPCKSIDRLKYFPGLSLTKSPPRH